MLQNPPHAEWSLQGPAGEAVRSTKVGRHSLVLAKVPDHPAVLGPRGAHPLITTSTRCQKRLFLNVFHPALRPLSHSLHFKTKDEDDDPGMSHGAYGYQTCPSMVRSVG